MIMTVIGAFSCSFTFFESGGGRSDDSGVDSDLVKSLQTEVNCVLDFLDFKLLSNEKDFTFVL